jgi:hypothetical protein
MILAFTDKGSGEQEVGFLRGYPMAVSDPLLSFAPSMANLQSSALQRKPSFPSKSNGMALFHN